MAAQTPARTSQTALTAGQLTMLAAVALATAGKGAFYRQGQLVSGTVLAAAVALAVGASRGRVSTRGIPRSVTLVVASLLAFGLWTVVRGTVGHGGVAGVPVLLFTVALSAGFLMGHLATSRQRATLRAALIGLGAVSALVGWVGFVWRIRSLALPSLSVWRAAGTLTYENALACLLAVAALVTVATLVERWTATAAAALCLMLVGTAATQSRGGVLILLVGALVLLVRLGARPVVRAGWRPTVGAAIATVGLVPSASVFTPPRPLPALAGLLVGTAVAAWPRRRESIGGTGVVALGVAALLAVVAGAGLASRLDAVTFESLEKRLSLKSPHRIAQHRVAVEQFVTHPVIGTGPGRAVLRWRDEDRILRARFVHNEYLQVAVELGTVGGLLLIAVLAAIGHAVWKGRSAGGAPWAGVAAAVVATTVHGAFDFVWHMPVIPFVVILLAGTATVPAERADVSPPA